MARCLPLLALLSFFVASAFASCQWSATGSINTYSAVATCTGITSGLWWSPLFANYPMVYSTNNDKFQVYLFDSANYAAYASGGSSTCTNTNCATMIDGSTGASYNTAVQYTAPNNYTVVIACKNAIVLFNGLCLRHGCDKLHAGTSPSHYRPCLRLLGVDHSELLRFLRLLYMVR